MVGDCGGWPETAGKPGGGNERQKKVGASQFEWRIMRAGF